MSNKNRKVVNNTVNVSSEVPVQDRTPEEQQKWLQEPATRAEVSQFVQSYIANEFTPVLLKMIATDLFQMKCMNEMMLKYLIDSGTCTVEQFENDYKEYYQRRLKEQQDTKNESNGNDCSPE